MNLSYKLKIYFFPILFLIVPAIFLIYFHLFNLYFRGVHSPFLYPALGLLLLSCFFWIKKRWVYFLLMGITAVYLGVFFGFLLLRESPPGSVVYYYRNWLLNTQTGLLTLKKPVGPQAPPEGSYISCNFNLKEWKNYFETQPVLCTAFDPQLRLQMFLNDHDTAEGTVREVQINFFRVERKSLLGEPLDRSAIRIAFDLVGKNLQPKYRLRTVYQVYEREIRPGLNKIVESFSRDYRGRLRSFTESPFSKFSDQDVYALYDADGVLVEIPRSKAKNYSFPALIDIGHYREYQLPEIINADNFSS